MHFLLRFVNLEAKISSATGKHFASYKRANPSLASSRDSEVNADILHLKYGWRDGWVGGCSFVKTVVSQGVAFLNGGLTLEILI